MSEVVFYAAVSRDGFLAGANGDMTWAEKYLGDNEDYGYYSLVVSCGAMLMGRRTFEFELEAIGEMQRVLPTYVLTNEPLRFDGFKSKDVHFVAGEIGMIIDLIRERHAGNLFLVGGADVVAQAIKAGRIDKVQLFECPEDLGDGLTLFGEGVSLDGFELESTKNFNSGLTERVYRLR
jgi:dihydrofolate reductase